MVDGIQARRCGALGLCLLGLSLLASQAQGGVISHGYSGGCNSIPPFDQLGNQDIFCGVELPGFDQDLGVLTDVQVQYLVWGSWAFIAWAEDTEYYADTSVTAYHVLDFRVNLIGGYLLDRYYRDHTARCSDTSSFPFFNPPSCRARVEDLFEIAGGETFPMAGIEHMFDDGFPIGLAVTNGAVVTACDHGDSTDTCGALNVYDIRVAYQVRYLYDELVVVDPPPVVQPTPEVPVPPSIALLALGLLGIRRCLPGSAKS